MPITGLRGTDDWLTNQRPLDWRQGMLLLYPNSSMPLVALTSIMKKAVAEDPQFNWFEKQFNPQRIVLNANMPTPADAGDIDSLTITAGGQFGGALQVKKDTLLYVEQTGEVVRVTADPPTDTSIDVERGIGQTGTISPGSDVDYDGDAVNPYMTVIGTAFMEGQDIPLAIGQNPSERFNYTQIFRDSLAITRTAQNTKLRTGEQVAESKREALEQHGIGMERGFLFGKKSQDLSGELPRRTTDGIVSYLEANLASTNVTDYAGAATGLAQLEDLLQEVFYYGSDEKMCFCGNSFVLAVNRIIRLNSNTPYTISQGQKEFGMNIQRLTSPFGELILKRHPLLNEMPGGLNPTTQTTPFIGWDSAGIVMDMKNVRYRYLKNSDTTYKEKRQNNGLDGMKSEYLTECGLEFSLPKTHYLIKGLNNAAADADV